MGFEQNFSICFFVFVTSRIAQAVKSTMKSSDNKTDSVKLKQTLGVAQYDETLLKYWMDAFCK